MTLLSLCLSLLSSAITPGQTPMSATESWTMFRGDLSHSGIHASDRAAADIQNPERIWEFDTGGVVESTPTLVDGVLYVGTFDNHLFAIEAQTGKDSAIRRRWIGKSLSIGSRRACLLWRRRQSILLLGRNQRGEGVGI